MKRRAWWWVVIGLVPCACGPDVVADVSPSSDAGSSERGSSGVEPSGEEDTGSDATTQADETTSGATTTTVDQTGDGSSSTGVDCDEHDECRTGDDCALSGAVCFDCACYGGVVCEEWGEGEWTDCVPGETCTFACEELCDCPPAPTGYFYQLTCGPIGGSDPLCYLSCENGEACPDGWTCLDETMCGVAIPPSYNDCHNYGTPCPAAEVSGAEGTCVDVSAPAGQDDGGICSTDGCIDADDCPDAPASGSAIVACTDALDDGENECVLDCSLGRACPDGASCHSELGICYYEHIDVGPYDACAGLQHDCDLCITGENASACTSYCNDVDDCPSEPSGTGNASLACEPFFIVIGLCVLECLDGETCPDGMVCSGGICMSAA